MNTDCVSVGVADDGDFPVGLRVLVVDEDPTCLKILDNLLRECHYSVTTTTEAQTALDMLREDANDFDLIITSAQMPNFDGFKLLETVGRETNLPVIMMSVDNNPELVLQGVKHGACDYLVKPVRIEQLKNIWRHVYQKKFDSREKGGQIDALNGHENQTRKRNRERMVEDDEEEESDEENGLECEESGNQKKPRIVWSPELHRKFVEAINQLGLEKAAPKRILEVMNVERLTRENVAAHLQKYRLYLKMVNDGTIQQANNADDMHNRETRDEEPENQTKPKFVWSTELHTKFVAAVNQLGFEKASPKRILEVMNVEGLSRENVACHMQKYRIYLKRISNAANQLADSFAELGINNGYDMPKTSLDGRGDSGPLSRPINSTGIALRNPASSPKNPQNLCKSVSDNGKLQVVIVPTIQSTNPCNDPPALSKPIQFPGSLISSTYQQGQMLNVISHRLLQVMALLFLLVMTCRSFFYCK